MGFLSRIITQPMAIAFAISGIFAFDTSLVLAGPDPLTTAAHQMTLGDLAAAEAALGIPQPREHKPSLNEAGAHLLYGILNVSRGEGRKALPSFQYLSRWDLPVSDYVNYFHALALTQDGRPMEALPMLEALRVHPRTQLRQRAAFSYADVLQEAERHWDAIREYESLLETFPFWPDRGKVQLRLALSHEKTGKLTHAARIFRSLLISPYPEEVQAEARKQLSRLGEEGVYPPAFLPRERFVQGQALGRMRQWNRALKWLTALQTDLGAAGVTPKLLREVREEIAGILFRANRFPEALSTFRALWDESPNRAVGLGLARTLHRLGHLEEAEAAHQNRTNAGVSQQRILADIADMYFREGDYIQALRFQKQVTSHKSSHRWRLAWLHFQTSEEKAAIAQFRAFARATPKKKNKARYWEARALYRIGKREEATTLYQRIARVSPFSYYGLQSQNRLYENGEIPECFMRMAPADWPKTNLPNAGAHWPASVSRDLQEEALRTSVEDHPVALLKNLTQQHGNKLPSLTKAHWLLQMGLVDESRQELRFAFALVRDMREGTNPAQRLNQLPRIGMDGRKARHQTDRWGGPRRTPGVIDVEEAQAMTANLEYLRRRADELVPPLQKALAGFGVWTEETMARQRAIGRSPRPGANRERGKWRFVFPLPYGDTVISQAEKHQLDPLLLWSLMRIESRYDPLAVSRSLAKGLMQILPRTGRLISEAIEDGDFVVDALHHPSTNIQYSAWYLNELMEKFHEQTPLAICSYNAGPFNVDRWISQKGSLPTDEFIEEVPSIQAREYTKKALGVLLTYRWIYYGIETLYLSNHLDTEMEDNIGF